MLHAGRALVFYSVCSKFQLRVQRQPHDLRPAQAKTVSDRRLQICFEKSDRFLLKGLHIGRNNIIEHMCCNDNTCNVQIKGTELFIDVMANNSKRKHY